MSLKSRILQFLSSEEPTIKVEEVQLSDMKLEDGTVITSEDWAEGGAVFIKGESEEDENIKLPAGSYQLDGKTLVVEEEGIIKSYGEAEAEEANEEPSEEKEEELAEEPAQEEEIQEEPAQEEPAQEEAPQVDAQVQELIIVIASLEQRIAALEGGQELSKEDEPKEGEVNLSSEEVKVETKEEEPKPIVHTPAEKSEKKASFYFGKR